MVAKAAAFYEAEEDCAEAANSAKLLASEASWAAAEAAMQTFGGFAFARDYGIERKWRETRLYQTAPISTNLILSHIAQHVLDLPRSFSPPQGSEQVPHILLHNHHGRHDQKYEK